MALTNTDTQNYVISRGEVHFSERKADGTLAGERDLGEAPTVGLTVSTQTATHYSSKRGVRVQNRSVPTQVDRSAKFGLDEINPRNMAILLLGSAAAVATTALADQTETFHGVEKGLSYQVGISATHPAGLEQITITAVKVGGVAKTLGTDYTKDEALGRITILESGAIADNADVEVDYDRLASTQETSVSGRTVVEGALRVIEYNLEGDDKTWYFPDVKLSPDGDFTIKSENDWQKMSFKVDVQEPNDGRPAIIVNGRAFVG